MPARTKPMPRGKPIKRSTTARKPRRRDTGPTQKTRDLVHARSGDMCEWPDCLRPRAEVHHRLGRKDGGRGGAMRARLNGSAWLLDACLVHHRMVTSPWGDALIMARASGWLLMEGQDAELVAVWTRHSAMAVLLDGHGGTTETRNAHPRPPPTRDEDCDSPDHTAAA